MPFVKDSVVEDLISCDHHDRARESRVRKRRLIQDTDWYPGLNRHPHMVQTSISNSYKAKKKTSAKDKEAKLPCAAVRARWKKEVARTKWAYDEWYKHPKGTQVRKLLRSTVVHTHRSVCRPLLGKTRWSCPGSTTRPCRS